MTTALIFGDDTGPSLAVARSLGRRGIKVHLAGVSGSKPVCRSRYVSRGHPIPAYIGAGGVWLERIQSLIEEHDYALILPTSDCSFAQLVRHRAELGSDRVAVPNPEAAETFVDKAATRRLAEKLGVPVPRGVALPASGSFAQMPDDLPLPAALKRRRSYACGDSERKSEVRLVHDRDELRRELQAGRFELAEEFLPGFCRGVSVIAREGQVLVAHQHRRLRQEHATGPSSARVSEPCDPQLLEWTGRMVAATNLTGVAMFEYRHHPRSGRTVLLEVNPRFWGSLPLALAAGLDFPALLYAMLVERRDPAPAIGSRPGIEKRNLTGERHALGVAREEASSPADHLRLAARLTEMALRLVGGRRFDSWAADDPEPFRAERRELLADLSRFCAERFGGDRRRNPAAVR